MAKELLIGADDLVGTWVHTRLDSRWIPGRGNAIGIIEDGKIVVGWTYSDYNRVNVVLDVVAEAKNWATPGFLYYFFSYPFDQLKCKRVTSPVSIANKHCQQFVEWLGAKHEFTMKDACVDGDVMIYKMTRDECRWLTKPAELPRIVRANI